jgi:hypothetical protein
MIFRVTHSMIGEHMVVPASDSWKLVLAIVLGVAIFASAYVRAPRRAASRGELGQLVLCALGLYAIGGLASLTRHEALAGMVYAAGIATCAFAAWLSRGTDSDDPPGGGDDPADEQPPPDPDGVTGFDWDEFERAFRSYADRERERVG